MKPSGYDENGLPVYDRPIAVVDVWTLLGTGQADIQGAAFGEARPNDIQRLMGALPDLETGDYAPDVPWRAEYGALAFTGVVERECERALRGVYFGGDTAESLPPGIEQAAAWLDAFGGIKKPEDIWAGQAATAVRLAGFPVTHFATLPRFINCIPADAVVACSAMPMRKSVSLSVRNASRQLKAEFILKAFKFDYSEPFHIDYCLHTLSVTDQR